MNYALSKSTGLFRWPGCFSSHENHTIKSSTANPYLFRPSFPFVSMLQEELAPARIMLQTKHHGKQSNMVEHVSVPYPYSKSFTCSARFSCHHESKSQFGFRTSLTFGFLARSPVPQLLPSLQIVFIKSFKQFQGVQYT